MSKTNTELLNRSSYDIMTVLTELLRVILLESCTFSVKTDYFVSSQMLRKPAVPEKSFADVFKKFSETSKLIFFPPFCW